VTDGTFINGIRKAMVCIICIPVLIVMLLLGTLGLNIGGFGCDGNVLFDLINHRLYWISDNVLKPQWKMHDSKSVIFGSSLLIACILLEDIPQVVIIFLIEDKIKLDHPRGNISSTAFLNLTFIIFDILYKFAKAIDLESDVNYVVCTIQGNEKCISSLTVAGANQLLSTSWDETAKLWNTTTGKCIKEFKCEYIVNDAVVLGDSKVIISCSGYRICICNIITGDLENTIHLTFRPVFVSLSPDGKCIFTGGSSDGNFIQRWDDLLSNECSFIYNWSATSLVFLDNDTFVSINAINKNEKYVRVGNINITEPTQTFKLQSQARSVVSMSPTVFLIGDTKGNVHQFVCTNYEWKLDSTTQQSRSEIDSLTKVNEFLFVVSDEAIAKLCSIKNPSLPLFVFRGHVDWIHSSVFLKGQNAIATGDIGGYIEIWSIEKDFENYLQKIPKSNSKGDNLDGEHNV